MTKWLDRRIAAAGPYMCLCLSEREYLRAMKHCKVLRPGPWIKNDFADATVHILEAPNRGQVAIVCLRPAPHRTPIEIAGLLVHEAVHIWQHYQECIGERFPGAEQEAYAIQSISQELMAAYSDSLPR